MIGQHPKKEGDQHRQYSGEREEGYSLIELILSLVITLVILGIAVATFSSALGVRNREGSTTDAITSAQAALNIVSREIGNSGFGLSTNGIVLADSGAKQIHIRGNVGNLDGVTSSPGEDVTFYFDSSSQSVVKYDSVTGISSGVINRVSDVDFSYHNYNPDGSFTTSTTPATNTGRVTVTLQVILDDVVGQPSNRVVTVRSDVTLRNSPYMLGQY